MEGTISDERQATAYGRIEELYVMHAPGALRLAYFLTGNKDMAEDLVQEAFVRMTGRFRHRRFPEDFSAYLRRSIVNSYLSQLRRRRLERSWLARQRTDPEMHPAHDPGERDELWRALQQLPERQRAAIVLRFYQDASEREAADVLRCSRGALNQLVTRGLAKLRKEVRKDA